MNTRSGLLTRAGIVTLASVLAFASLGWSYWRIPYNTVNLPDALLIPALGLIPLGAFALRLSRVAPWWLATLAMGVAAPAMVMVRVVVDCAQDPTRHNLWPFEMIIASFVSFPLAFAGALAGLVAARLVFRPAEIPR